MPGNSSGDSKMPGTTEVIGKRGVPLPPEFLCHTVSTDACQQQDPTAGSPGNSHQLPWSLCLAGRVQEMALQLTAAHCSSLQLGWGKPHSPPW